MIELAYLGRGFAIIFGLVSPLMLLTGCTEKEERESLARMQAKMPPGCEFKDFGDHTRADGGNIRVAAVICKDSIVTTSGTWKAGKTTIDQAITVDTRENR